MLKPQGYDNTEAKSFGDYERPQPGPVVFKILKAEDVVSQEKGRPMLVLYLDIAKGPFTGHFRKLFDFLKSKNSESKWPCVHRRCQDGDQVSYFKGDIKAIEESNMGFTFNFDEKTLTGKLVGGMLGEKEIDSTGKTILEPRFLCSVAKAESGTLKIPTRKAFSGYGGVSSQSQNQEDQELPF